MYVNKLLLTLFISIFCVCVFAQNVSNNDVVKTTLKEQQSFKTLVKFKPLATILGAIMGSFNFEVAGVPYVHPNIGIPIELQFAYANKVTGVALMTGIEAVPFTYREKSGLYLNYEAGCLFVSTGDFGFCTAGHIGYQVVAKRGFVFTPAVGFKYDTLVKTVGLHIMFDFGFAL